MGDRDLRGIERAAILVSALGENAAADIFKYLEPRDIHSIAYAMARMEKVSRTQLNIVLNEFCSAVEGETGLAVKTDRFLKSVLPKALGNENAGNILERIYISNDTKGLESLKWMEPRAVSDLLHQEHPQVIAIVLTYLNAEHSADILEYFPDDIRTDVLKRIATLDGIQPSAMNELSRVIEQLFARGVKEDIKSSSIDGIRKAAKILKYVNIGMEVDIIENINMDDPDLGQKIMDAMFVFEDLLDIDDRDIQTILREITSESLVVALKGSDDALKEKIFSNMSKRAAGMLREDIEERGPVRLREVNFAKKEILDIARRLASAGDISLGKPGTTIYV